ncbi:hypothetical protein J6590_099034 [Homalodisca vitripennis]|nr:hypothetical protein J6590_099034 [Homalodisca vitripennis]
MIHHYQWHSVAGHRKTTSSVAAAWMGVTAERSCPCKQSTCLVGGGGSEVTFKPLVPRLSVREDFLTLTSPEKQNNVRCAPRLLIGLSTNPGLGAIPIDIPPLAIAKKEIATYHTDIHFIQRKGNRGSVEDDNKGLPKSVTKRHPNSNEIPPHFRRPSRTALRARMQISLNVCALGHSPAAYYSVTRTRC